MQLLEYFKDLTLHPKNAEELKGLILELALRGKLTGNLSRNNIKKDVIPGYYVLPEDWYWDKFQNLCDFQMGKTPPSKESQYWDGGIPWISIADMDTYQTIYDSKKTISDLGLKNYFKGTLVEKGTLIMSFKLTIGKTSILGVDACHNEAIISIYPKKEVLQEFLFLFLPIISNWGTQVSALMGNTLNKGKIQSLKVPVPPLEEQKAIVEIVNQLFTEVEKLEELTKERIQFKEDFVTSALNQLTQAMESDVSGHWGFLKGQFGTFFTEKENIKKLREAILQLAVQGKLTHHWRNNAKLNGIEVEHASILLEKIKAEKEQLIKAGKIKKEKPLPEISEDEIPYELPEGWVWCRLGEITTIKGGKRLPKGHTLTIENTGRIYIRVTDMKNGTIDDSNLHYISEEVFEQISNYIIEKEDLYLTIVGATIGKLGLVPEKFHRMNLTENAARIIKYQINKELLFYFMVSDFVQNQFFDKTNQVGVPKLALHRVAKTFIPLPPFTEQKAIVEKVNALMGLCDQLEQEIENHLTIQEQWMQSCLREVFEPKVKEDMK